MNRRDFLHLASVGAALAADGHLPLLAAPPRPDRPRRRSAGQPAAGPGNIFTEPAAVEPVTGYLRRFTPVAAGSMRGGFSATYALVKSLGAAAVSRNVVSGSLTVAFRGQTCTSRQTRQNRPASVTETRLNCAGEVNTARTWTLRSSIEGAADLTFEETGTFDGTTMTVKAKAWKCRRNLARPLIGQWALLPLLAAGKFRNDPLRFDMLDSGTVRPEQVLRYRGKIAVPIASRAVTLDCYAQTGRSVLPIHYLVDDAGRVQLITQETVNWALTSLT